ncbi:MAG: hypothetical protein CVU59_05295 [Deltaproteobacteria bacterium HGW-Deltaproteobacteria-17]|nr:MAG: hypothetical protein CVU59_05295 [Deltaproteobacteria bacterium HGW-Deltaproteobacteria-17]
MKVLSLIPLDDCLGSTHSVRCHLDAAMTEEAMRRLAEGGRLEYFPHFPRPFFRVDHPAHFIAQGVLGNDHFRLTYLKQYKDAVREALQTIFSESEPCQDCRTCS